VDGLGNPIGFALAAGQTNDLKASEPLLEGVRAGALIGDKAFDADNLIGQLQDRKIRIVIPPKRNRLVQRSYDRALYKECNLIERFFNKLKQFRGIATRYDKRPRNFIAGVHLAAATILLK
jgi:transposase